MPRDKPSPANDPTVGPEVAPKADDNIDPVLGRPRRWTSPDPEPGEFYSPASFIDAPGYFSPIAEMEAFIAEVESKRRPNESELSELKSVREDLARRLANPLPGD